MADQLPFYVPAVFILTALLSVWMFYRATQRSIASLLILIGWLLLQGALAYLGFYQNADSVLQPLAIMVGPPLLFILLLLILPAGRRFMNSLNPMRLTNLHLVRLPVEIVLYWLLLQKLVPEAMTLEGRNFDILFAISALPVAYFGYREKSLPAWMLILWNIIGLVMLANVVVIAILSAPQSFQEFGMEQPNVAVFYFPFVWLPAVVVPLVLLSHLALVRDLVLPPASPDTEPEQAQ